MLLQFGVLVRHISTCTVAGAVRWSQVPSDTYIFARAFRWFKEKYAAALLVMGRGSQTAANENDQRPSIRIVLFVQPTCSSALCLVCESRKEVRVVRKSPWRHHHIYLHRRWRIFVPTICERFLCRDCCEMRLRRWLASSCHSRGYRKVCLLVNSRGIVSSFVIWTATNWKENRMEASGQSSSAVPGNH